LAVADSIIAVHCPIQSIEKENDRLSLLVDQQVSDNLIRDAKIKGLTKKMDRFEECMIQMQETQSDLHQLLKQVIEQRAGTNP
jgi:hypothetical protein